MTPRAFVQSGNQEFVKGAFHVALGLLVAPMAAYNIVAWWYRRERHLAINGVIYSTLVALEVRKVLHHLKDDA